MRCGKIRIYPRWTKVLYSIILIVSIPWSDDLPTSIENLVSIIPQDDLVPLSNAIIKRIAGEQVESTTVKRDLKGNIFRRRGKEGTNSNRIPATSIPLFDGLWHGSDGKKRKGITSLG